MHDGFLIWGVPYSHRSAGVRALYRLCHHLNRSGYRAAMLTRPSADLPDWDVRFHDGDVGDSIVVYPEVVSGNPFGATRVVRWALNSPGLLGGDDRYSADEMVFVYDPQKLEVVSRACGVPLGPRRVLWMGLVDPDHIYPDPAVPKTLDCSFTHKGRVLSERFSLPGGADMPRLEDLATSMAALGDTLRRTRTLYSFDHYSNVLREAAISGCQVRTVDAEGRWHDPTTCSCPLNVLWKPGFRETYARDFRDSRFVPAFIREVRTRWHVPPPELTGWPSGWRGALARLRRRGR